MKQSELTYCANRAKVLRATIRRAKGAVNSQQPEIVEDAIAVAADILARLSNEIRPTLPTPPAPKDTRDGRVPDAIRRA